MLGFSCLCDQTLLWDFRKDRKQNFNSSWHLVTRLPVQAGGGDITGPVVSAWGKKDEIAGEGFILPYYDNVPHLTEKDSKKTSNSTKSWFVFFLFSHSIKRAWRRSGNHLLILSHSFFQRIEKLHNGLWEPSSLNSGKSRLHGDHTHELWFYTFNVFIIIPAPGSRFNPLRLICCSDRPRQRKHGKKEKKKKWRQHRHEEGEKSHRFKEKRWNFLTQTI